MRFRVLGIPVTVDPFFLLGLVFIWSWAGGDRAGLYAAGFVAVFTLVHELGHALTARHFGADSAITLNLLVGWASYASARPLTTRQRNLITLAGPITQLVLALPVLWITYQALPDAGSLEAALVASGESVSVAFDLWIGAIWAGVIIGLLNLLPLWPLDGGHLVDSAMTAGLGWHRGRRVMLVGTLVLVGIVTALGLLAQDLEPPRNSLQQLVVEARLAPLAGLTESSFGAALWEQVRTFPGTVLDFPFMLLIFCGLNAFLSLQRMGRPAPTAAMQQVRLAAPESAPRRHGASAPPVPDEAMTAERMGWLMGTLHPYPAGWAPSPWLVAYLEAGAGDRDAARRALAIVTLPGSPHWTVGPPQNRPELAALVELLPEPLVVGDPQRSRDLMEVLASYGSAEQVAHYGVDLYRSLADPDVLYSVAAGLARTGHHDDAMAWLHRAVLERPDPQRMADERLGPLRSRAEFHDLLARVQRWD